MKIQKLLYVVVSLLLFTVSSIADDITLDFEGLKNMEQVQNFYNGGAGSEGSTKGLDYNITFSANTLALIDKDAGGGGNFANEPSPDTTFFFTGSDTNIYMNVEGGFTEGFSFYYTSIIEEGDVEVWTELNGQGKRIGTLHLDITPSLGKGDPYGDYDNWAKKSLSFDGRAKSIVFKGVANQIAFDNISLNPRSEQTIMNGISIAPIGAETDTEALSHGKCNISNEFLVTLKFKTNDDLTDICDNFDFEFIGDKGGAMLSDCDGKVNKCDIDKTFNFTEKNEYKLSLNFKIKKLDDGYFFKNGKLKVSKINDGKSATVEIWENFNAYGTEFDIKKDAFSFQNGYWNEAVTNRDTKNQLIFKNDIAKAGDIVADYLEPLEDQASFWNSVGWRNKTLEKGLLWGYNTINESNQASQGLCYGMALASASNFIHKNDSSWGMGTLDKWESEIDEHWDNTKNETDALFPKPFNTNKVYDYDINDIQALKKIMYYFVAQPFYSDTFAEQWVGEEKTTTIYPLELIKKNQPIPIAFYYELGGGHQVLNTEYFSYSQNNNKYFKYIIYDNNEPNTYTNVKGIEEFTDFNEKIDNYIGEKLRRYDFVKLDTDILHIYTSITKQQNMKQYKKVYSKQTKDKRELTYNFPNHIKIYMVGGIFKKVSLRENGKNILLYPFVDAPIKGKAYKSEDNIFNNVLLLPSDKKYEITVQKQANFATIKFFVTIPKKDGTAEYMGYNHAEVSEKDPTTMSFVVGIDNNDTSIKREGADDYKPDAKEVYKLKLNSIASLNTIVVNNSIKLSWKNPIHPNYEESVVVRKEDTTPSSIIDGTEIYRGTDEEFLDTTIASEKKYYYAVYAVSKDNEPTEPVWTDVDTYRYTLYGTLSDASDEPIAGATVTLYNGTKTRLIETSFSSNTGLFSFNNLLDGEYVLNFSHPSYTFEKSELNVTVEKKSKEVLMKAEGVANLFMDIPQAVKVGESQTIIWDGVHIDNGATVNIKLFRDEKWETVASSVPYNQHSYQWNVTAPKGEAKLRIELDNTTFVEKDLFIFGADELKYDFDNDGDIDVDDIMIVVKGWNSKIGDADYSSTYDYNGDGVIDIKDVMMIASKWGS